MRRFRQVSRYLLLFAVCVAALPASARDYRIEIVLFENRFGEPDDQGQLWFPRVEPAMGLSSDEAQNASFIPISGPLNLAAEAEKMDRSGRYRVLSHFAWRQPGLDDEAAKAIWIVLGDRIPMYLADDFDEDSEFVPASAEIQPDRERRVNSAKVFGTIKVRLGRFLHMDTHLVYTDAANGLSYRMLQSRKMRSRELHFIDNPRFGILTRILPIEEDEDAATG